MIVVLAVFFYLGHFKNSFDLTDLFHLILWIDRSIDRLIDSVNQ